MKKLKKLTFCPPARQADAHRIIVNKIKDELDSSIKITSPHRNHRDRSRDVRRSHLPLKLEPVEASGSWRSWCRCFFSFPVMCCGGGLCSERREEERPLLRQSVVALSRIQKRPHTSDMVWKNRLRIPRWFLRFILSWVSYFSSDFEGYIRRNRYFFNKVYWEAVKI